MEFTKKPSFFSDLPSKNATTELEQFSNRLKFRLFAILMFIGQVAVRLYSLLKSESTPLLNTLYIIAFASLLCLIAIIALEYTLYKKLGPKILRYTKIIDGLFFVFFYFEWMIALAIPTTVPTYHNGPYVKMVTAFLYTSFCWRTLLQNIIIHQWQLRILTPLSGTLFIAAFSIYYDPNNTTVILSRGISQIVFIISILYFENKMSLNLLLANLKQAQWMQVSEFILDSIPENIAIFDLNGETKYLSAYFLQLLQQSDCPNNIDKFFGGIKNLRKHEPTETSFLLNGTQLEKTNAKVLHQGDHIISMPSNASFEEKTLQDLLNNFKANALKDVISEKSFFIYNGKLETNLQRVEKSVEIKMSFIKQQNLKFILLILRDTTQHDRLITLESNDKYKDQLLASVSHELRTPLNGSINLVESAIRAKEIPETIKEQLLNPALRSCKFLTHLINDILDMSQIKAHKLRLAYQEANIKETLKDTIQLVSLQAKRKGLKLEISFDPSAPERFCTDHVRLSQIVLNLLNNSIKFTQEGFVKLTVKASQKYSNCLKIRVDDSGMGMNQKDLSKLFTRFTHIEHPSRETVNPGGAGLGLNIAYNLAELLGSPNNKAIKVSSTPNLGSSFSFILENKTKAVLPGYQAESLKIPDEMNNESDGTIDTRMKTLFTPRLNKHQSAPTPDTKCPCPKILIVDDDQFNVFAFEAILNSFNLKYDVTFTGNDALEKLCNKKVCSYDSNCKSYQLIFMDREMPFMDGCETVKEIKRLQSQNLLKKELAIVGCTAHNDINEIDNFMSCGLDDCLTKPISRDRVYETFMKFDALYF